MHHVRIALDKHEPFHLHRAVFADAAKVVAAEVHQHNVFGALFRIGEKFRFQFAVFGFVAAARNSAGDRPIEASRPCTFTSISGELATTETSSIFK